MAYRVYIKKIGEPSDKEFSLVKGLLRSTEDVSLYKKSMHGFRVRSQRVR
jgi:predicted phosphoribosyltransferase